MFRLMFGIMLRLRSFLNNLFLLYWMMTLFITVVARCRGVRSGLARCLIIRLRFLLRVWRSFVMVRCLFRRVLFRVFVMRLGRCLMVCRLIDCLFMYLRCCLRFSFVR